ncbi:ABC transporter substrate-binding protein [Vulgatibacter incomptus]|uniref:Oligopeptide ABC transporter, periplasmic oligopeptide-binding protein OppA n=1 Tax=Vulgatibacter incomptus TaxID=1391653 RepID=A0A0K1PC31_9BACT|nr:ABC transporter substrate-binding protein [Vulgatibacter incomptus]AKU91062.1 Oligopeptide ABC transporter, periplasmic oligopeptide-binding protein OppA [Vulgatibacter incomptus]
MSKRGSRVGLALLLLVSAACTRGRTPEEKQAARAARLASAAPLPEWIDEPWRDGVLPPGLEEGEPVQGGTITVRLNIEPGSLGYLIDPDWWAKKIVLHDVTEALLRPDPRGHPDYPLVPELAESWEESADHRTQTFHLRKGVRWHDGAPFTSRDVKFTIDRILDPTVRAAHHRNGFAGLARVETPDDHTVIFRWNEPYVWALRNLASLPMYPAHAFAGYEGAAFNTAPFMRAPIGTGPFRFVSWKEKKAITLARNDDYWGPKAHVDRVVYRVVEEANVAQQLMMRGELDLDLALTPEQYVQVAQERRLFETYHRLKAFDAKYSFISWNVERPALRDPRVRRALTMLLDRELIRTTLRQGVDLEANCIFYHEGTWCDPGTRQAPYDPLAAIRLLADAGWSDTDGDGILDKDGVPLRFSISLPSAPSTEQMLLAYKQALFRAGIELEVQKLEWSVFSSKIRAHEIDAGIMAWIMDIDGDPYSAWHSSQIQGGSNYTGYRNPELDRLAEAIRGEFSAEARAELGRRINSIVVSDNPQTLLFHSPRMILLHRRLSGVYVSPIESFQLRDMWIDPDWRKPDLRKEAR